MNIMELLRNAPVASFIFLVTLVTSLAAFNDPLLRSRFILHPFSFFRRKKYYTILTSGLIHANGMHLAFNMLTFYFFAFQLEKIMVFYNVYWGASEFADMTMLKVLGHLKFFLIYLASLVLSDISTLIKHRENPAYASLGASGAISGIVLSAVIFVPQLMIYGFIPGWVFAILYLAYSYYAARKSHDNINHDAHLWGALAGIVFTLILFPKSGPLFWKTVSSSLGF